MFSIINFTKPGSIPAQDVSKSGVSSTRYLLSFSDYFKMQVRWDKETDNLGLFFYRTLSEYCNKKSLSTLTELHFTATAICNFVILQPFCKYVANLYIVWKYFESPSILFFFKNNCIPLFWRKASPFLSPTFRKNMWVKVNQQRLKCKFNAVTAKLTNSKKKSNDHEFKVWKER